MPMDVCTGWLLLGEYKNSLLSFICFDPKTLRTIRYHGSVQIPAIPGHALRDVRLHERSFAFAVVWKLTSRKKGNARAVSSFSKISSASRNHVWLIGHRVVDQSFAGQKGNSINHFYCHRERDAKKKPLLSQRYFKLGCLFVFPPVNPPDSTLSLVFVI